MSLYEFKESDAWDFARQQGIQTKQKGEELHFMHCPYCGSTKDKWTFAIDLRTGQFKCLRASCSRTGNMITLSKDFDFSLGRDIDEYYNRSRKQYRTFQKPMAEIKPKAEALEYLRKRGISEAVAEKYQITTHKDKQNVLVFPFMDGVGNIVFVKYRKTDYDPKKDNSKEWCETNCKPILFGMYQCNTNNKTLVLTEGQIDSLSLSESGIENAVSVPTGKNGFTWFPPCWDWLQQFTELIVFGDCENGTITLLDEMKSRFPGTVKAVRQQDYKGCKDANELLLKYGKDAVRYAVNNAEIQPIRAVKELADVKAVDLFKMPKIPTGIARVDSVLSGGIYLGQTVIITGKRGEGKSTLASQIVANALNDGKNTVIGPAILSVFDAIGRIIIDTFNWDATMALFEDAKENFKEGGLNIILGVIEGILGAIGLIVEPIGDFFVGLWNAFCETFGIHSPAEEMKPLGENIILGVIEGMKAIFENVKSTIEELKKIISDKFKEILTDVDSKFKELKSKIFSKLSDIKSIWDSKWESFADKVSDVWGNIKDTISSAVDRIKEWINDLLSLFDKAKDKGSGLDGFGGGGSYRSSVNVPNATSLSIPALANGTVIPPNAPFMAILGDQKRGTNIEAPLDTIKQAVREVMGNSGEGKMIHNVLQLEGRVVYEEVIEHAKFVQAYTGRNPFDLA